MAAEDWHARFLDLAVGAPLLQVEGVVYSNQGQPVQFHQIITRTDHCRYHISVARQAGPG